MKIIILCKPSSLQPQRLLFLLKTQKATTLQQVTGGNTPTIVLKNSKTLSKSSTTQYLVLKKLLELFLTVPRLKKI